jgi:hypothetical protein
MFPCSHLHGRPEVGWPREQAAISNQRQSNETTAVSIHDDWQCCQTQGACTDRWGVRTCMRHGGGGPNTAARVLNSASKPRMWSSGSELSASSPAMYATTSFASAADWTTCVEPVQCRDGTMLSSCLSMYEGTSPHPGRWTGGGVPRIVGVPPSSVQMPAFLKDSIARRSNSGRASCVQRLSASGRWPIRR